ncbi:MAG: discoidin domain-containing protein, partial [Pseudoflavonifractor sp.]
YLTIARNISNAPKSGRIPAGDNGFPESEYIKAALLSVQKKVLSDAPLAQDAEVNSLLAELKNIALAVDDFCANCKNDTLIQQLKPWLNSLKAIAQSGAGGLEAAIAMQKGDFDSAWTGLSIAGTGLSAWDASVPDQRGGGSKRIQPFAAAVTAYISAKLTPILLPDVVTAAVTFYGKIGGTDQHADAESAKMLDGNPATYASYAVNQVQDDYYGVDLGKVTKVTGISILQGKPNGDANYYHNATLEYSSDGTVWNTLVQKVDSASIRTGALDLRARYLRLRLLSTGTTDPVKADYHTYVREFTVLTGAPADADTLVYTNVPALKSTVAAQDGSDFTLNAAGSVTLEKGEYLGLKLPEITGMSAVVTGAALPEGLTLQYSASGVVWTDGAPAVPGSVRYVRMVNLTDSAVTGSLPALTVTMNQPPFHPTLLDTSAGQAFKNDQAKVFDGDHGTLAYDNSNQQVGNYYTFDFGAKQPIYDLKFYSGENNDYIYNMDISLATSPDGPWKKVGTIDEDHPMIIEPPRRVFTCNADGMEARYLKLEVTKLPPKAQWLMLYEIEVNKAHALETSLGAFSGTPVGKFEALLDQNLATSFTPGTIAGKGGYVQYLISEHNAVKSLRILQNPKACSNAAVTVQTADGAWHDLGKLDAGSKQFNTAGLGNLTALRLNWVKGTTPAIAEIVLQGAPNQEQDPGVDPLSLPNLYRAPAVEPVTVNYGTPLTRAGLPTRLTVPLSSGANATLAVRWKSADYAADKAGDYACSGTFTMPAGIVNSAGLTLSATVTVKADAGSAQEPITGNLALGKAVAVSDVEIKSEVGAHAVDGTTGTRWSAWPLMKEKLDKNTENQIADVEWIVVDLDKAQGGTDLGGTNTIDKVTLTATANKAWGTKYAVQTSDDNITWKTVKECVW